MMGDYHVDDMMLDQPGEDQPDEETEEQPPQPPPSADEPAFRAWYAIKAAEQGLNQNPDDPQHFYDYRAAYKAGAKPDTSGHWPSQFKREGHPNLIVDGVDTRTGQPVAKSAYRTEPDPEYHTEADPDAQPGWMELAWNAVKGGWDQAAVVPLLKQLYNETGGEVSQAATAVASGQPFEALKHSVRALPTEAATRMGGQAITGLASMHMDQLRKFRDAYQQGDYLSAFGHAMAGVIPVIGPGAAAVGEEMGEGFATGDQRKVAHAVGAGTTQVAAALIPAAARTVAQSRPAARIGQMAERDLARATVPHVGANKARFGNIAMENAPRMVREPEMGAWSTGRFAEKVAAGHDAAAKALNTAIDAIPNTKMYATSPVVKRIDDAIRKLTPMGISGEAVEPANRAARIATLRQARDEVSKLGSNANMDTMRNLRQAWDEGAKKEFAPSIQQDWMKTRGEGKGWADARTALADYLGEREPALKPLNADYSFWRSWNDVIGAVEESELVRPNRMSKGLMMLGGTSVGAGVGGGLGGLPGAAIGGFVGEGLGAIAGEVMDFAMGSGMTARINTARSLAKLSDAIRSGNQASQVSAMRGLAAVTGTGKQLDEALRRAREESPPRE